MPESDAPPRIPKRIWVPTVIFIGSLAGAVVAGLWAEVDEPLALLVGGGFLTGVVLGLVVATALAHSPPKPARTATSIGWVPASLIGYILATQFPTIGVAMMAAIGPFLAIVILRFPPKETGTK